jgi:hypothetical protein
MKVAISPEDLTSTDLRPFNEVWLASPPAPLSVESTVEELCLWRGEQLFTHDMLSEGTHGQNVTRIWLIIEDVNDRTCVYQAEKQVKQRLTEQGMHGEFYPAEQVDTHGAT